MKTSLSFKCRISCRYFKITNTNNQINFPLLTSSKFNQLFYRISDISDLFLYLAGQGDMRHADTHSRKVNKAECLAVEKEFEVSIPNEENFKTLKKLVLKLRYKQLK